MPYRTPSPPTRDVSAPARWRRVKLALSELCPSLAAFPWFRRWVGGRWAECRMVPARMLVIVGAAALEATEHRWRSVAACPHECWVTISDDPAPVWCAPYCECEVYP